MTVFDKAATELAFSFQTDHEAKDSTKVDVNVSASYGGFFDLSTKVSTERTHLTSAFNSMSVSGKFLSGSYDRKHADLSVF